MIDPNGLEKDIRKLFGVTRHQAKEISNLCRRNKFTLGMNYYIWVQKNGIKQRNNHEKQLQQIDTKDKKE